MFVFLLTSSVYAKTLTFEDLLNNAVTEISSEIDGKVKSLAILDVKTEYWAVSDYIVDELAHYFTRRLSNTSGAFIPIVMEKIGVDPAVASGPLITTLSDLLGASSYYTLVYLVLKKVFHY